MRLQPTLLKKLYQFIQEEKDREEAKEDEEKEIVDDLIEKTVKDLLEQEENEEIRKRFFFYPSAWGQQLSYKDTSDESRLFGRDPNAAANMAAYHRIRWLTTQAKLHSNRVERKYRTSISRKRLRSVLNRLLNALVERISSAEQAIAHQRGARIQINNFLDYQTLSRDKVWILQALSEGIRLTIQPTGTEAGRNKLIEFFKEKKNEKLKLNNDGITDKITGNNLDSHEYIKENLEELWSIYLKAEFAGELGEITTSLNNILSSSSSMQEARETIKTKLEEIRTFFDSSTWGGPVPDSVLRLIKTSAVPD